MSHHTSKHQTTTIAPTLASVGGQATGPALAALVAATRRGCANAESDLYDQHLPMVTKVARRHGLNEHQCADVIQRSWLKARQGLHGLRRDDRFGPWLAAIARNESISMLRASAREVGFPDHDLADDRSTSPDRHLVRSEEWAMLRAAMARLDPADRELVRLLFEEGLAYQQVATVLGKPMGSIGPTRGRILRRLRHLIESNDLQPVHAA